MADRKSDVMEELLGKIKQMATEYDSTLLAAAMTMQSAQLGRGLIAVKKETPNSVTNIYGLALGDAFRATHAARHLGTIATEVELATVDRDPLSL